MNSSNRRSDPAPEQAERCRHAGSYEKITDDRGYGDAAYSPTRTEKARFARALFTNRMGSQRPKEHPWAKGRWKEEPATNCAIFWANSNATDEPNNEQQEERIKNSKAQPERNSRTETSQEKQVNQKPRARTWKAKARTRRRKRRAEAKRHKRREK